MSLSVIDGIATRLAGGPDRTHRVESAPLLARLGRTLWLRDRGVSELRWAAVTLWMIVLLAILAIGLDPSSGAFERTLLLSTPAAALLTVAAWGPFAARLGDARPVRMLIGPAVVLLTIVGAGLGDVATLQLSPAAPLVLLAISYAALTPGYALAAAVFAAASIAVLGAHWQATGGSPTTGSQIDAFVVRAFVILVASAGMAVVVRIATDAETRANQLADRSRERVDTLETLNRMVARFDGSHPVREVIQAVVDDIAREFDITLVSMYLPDAEGRLSMVGVAGYPSPFHVIENGVGIIGRAASTRRTQFVPDVYADPDYRSARADVRSEVAAPVVHLDELLGVVNFEGTLQHPIGPAQVALAEMVCHELSGALRSARLDDERRDRLHATERVLAVSRALVADLDRPRIVASIVEVAKELLAADVAALFTRGTDGTYRLESGSGFPPSVVGLEVSGRAGMVGRAIESAERIVGVQEVAAWPPEYLSIRPGGDTPHAALALPIVVGDEVAAVLLLTRVGSERRFTELELGTADLLSAQVAIALQNADLHARVAESALRDPLTGLLNRRYFDEAVETAWATAGRSGGELSLIVLDLDRFSDVNNTYGHAIGDTVLKRVARALTGSVRNGDVVVRYGGEEFVIIAPGSKADDAVGLAERVRAAVASASERPIDGLHVPLTISAGVASRLGDEADGRALFRAADSALLAAKRLGRDRVVSL